MLIKILVFCFLFFPGLAIQNCNTVDSSNLASESITGNPTPQTEIVSGKKVEFQGVSFLYNPQIFGEVKAEEVAGHFLENETDKPDFVAPRHRLFTFDLSTGYSPMQIAVYPINDFPRMYAANKSSVKAMEEEIENFKKVLINKNFLDGNNQIPFLPFRDAGQDFQVKVKHRSFHNGSGILFLTFWSTELEFPSNRQLQYIFEGLTKDEKYYIVAEMPVRVDFLPDESSDEYEGYKLPWGKLEDKNEMRRFAAVKRKIADRLEKLPEDEFQPNLNELEKIISTLKIEK